MEKNFNFFAGRIRYFIIKIMVVSICLPRVKAAAPETCFKNIFVCLHPFKPRRKIKHGLSLKSSKLTRKTASSEKIFFKPNLFSV